MNRAPKMLLLALAALLIASMTFAFAAGNTMPAAPLAGDGSSTISGYTVSNIAYSLDTSNPANITAVNFTLSAAATSVRASLGGATIACNPAGVNTWTCPVTSTVTLATDQYIVASQ